jgi:hypothetical protein
MSWPYVFNLLVKSSLELNFPKKPAYQFNHGKNSIILLNHDFAILTSIRILLDRKAIPGIVAEKNVEKNTGVLQ